MNLFEEACAEVDAEPGLMTNDNVIEFSRNAKIATVTLSQPKYINKIKTLAERFPDEVKIIRENPDSSIIAHIPVSYIKINNPPKREYSEEERALMVQRLKGVKE